MFRTALAAAATIVMMSSLSAQITSFPYFETFDASTSLPIGWWMEGWAVSTTSPRSSPVCLSATGNLQTHLMISPIVAFGENHPDRLSFYERRTSTALRYRLALWGMNEDSSVVKLLGRWDSAATANSYVERSVDLAASGIAGISGWRFVWEILRDSSNSSGVLRIDDVRILAAPAVDLSPVRIDVTPSQPRAGETITVSVLVRNAGRSAADPASLTVRWSSMVGGSGSVDRSPRIEAGDSLFVFASIPSPQPGRLELLAITDAAQDHIATNDTIRATVPVGIPPLAIVVNEVQFAPLREDEPEWVELFNPGPWKIPLSEVTVSDNSTTRVALTSRMIETLSPGQFVVVARSEVFSTHYPNNRYLLTLFPSLNNTTPDAVVLRDAQGRTIDSTWYQPAWGMAGRTLERRDWNMTSWFAGTWGPCEAAAGATPCAVNSIQRPEVDASCEQLIGVVHSGTTSLHLTALVRNCGRLSLLGGSVDWRLLPADSSAGGEIFLGTTIFQPIAPLDSALVEYRWTEEVCGPVRLRAVVSVPSDGNASNDTSCSSLLRPYPGRSLLVNEVMLEPSPGKPEWIELLNMGSATVDLAGWTIMDRPSPSGARTRTTLPSVPSLVRAGHMAVVASDPVILEDYPWLNEAGANVIIAPRSSGFGFNNDGDAVVIADRTGQVIDSVVVVSASHVEGVSPAGRSLERRSAAGPAVDPSAWTSCSDPMGASPGRQNSVSGRSETSTFSVRLDPDPFSPDGDAFEDVTVVRYASASPSLFLDARIYDLSGREVRRLADGNFVPASGSMTWDGRNVEGRLVPIGVYIVLITATDALTGRRESVRVLCSVAR